MDLMRCVMSDNNAQRKAIQFRKHCFSRLPRSTTDAQLIRNGGNEWFTAVEAQIFQAQSPTCGGIRGAG